MAFGASPIARADRLSGSSSMNSRTNGRTPGRARPLEREMHTASSSDSVGADCRDKDRHGLGASQPRQRSGRMPSCATSGGTTRPLTWNTKDAGRIAPARDTRLPDRLRCPRRQNERQRARRYRLTAAQCSSIRCVCAPWAPAVTCEAALRSPKRGRSVPRLPFTNCHGLKGSK